MMSTMYSCQLCKLDTVSDIFIKKKLHTNVKIYETKCRTYKPYFCLTYLWSYGPFNISVTVSDIFLKLYTNVYHHDMMCRTQEP